jgi:ribose transport system permease protein
MTLQESAEATTTTTPIQLKRRRGIVHLAEGYAVLGVLILIIVIFSILLPSSFPTYSTVQTILSTQSVLGLVAIGTLFPLIAGEFDLSIAAISGLCGLVSARLAADGSSAAIVICVTLVVALGVGFINGALTVYFKINSLISTLATATIISGVVIWISAGSTISIRPNGFFASFATPQIGGKVPVAAVYLAAVAILAWIFFEVTPWGRLFRITGASERAARLVGIGTSRIVLASFVVAGLIAGFSGLVSTSQLGSASPAIGPPYLLPAYAAAFVGSTTVRVGRFNVIGTLIALYLIAVGVTGLELEGVATYVLPIFSGAALIIAVAISIRTRRALTAA